MNLFHTHIAPRAVELAVETLRSGFVSEGKMVERFEAALAAELGLVQPVALASGTAALHLALAVAGVGPGDEVILPPQTFVATGLAVLHAGAIPVFADIDPTTGNLDPASAAARVTDRTRAILTVHWAGSPCALDALAAIASAHGIPVIEDAAHALGATYRGRPIGAISRFTCFSFQAIKHLTTGDGGALCCTEIADRDEARRRRWFGIDRARDQPDELGERVYVLEKVGFKYHMNDVAAAIGLGNLPDHAPRLARRREIDRRYRAALAGVPGVRLLRVEPESASACWLFTVRVDGRGSLVRKAAEAGVPVSVINRRIDRHPLFGGCRPDLPGQAVFDQEQLSLPAHDALSDDDVERVIGLLRSGW